MGNILWVASYPKSGNTWLRAFLANLIADRRDALRPDELRSYADVDARADYLSEVAGRSSIDLSVSELCALRQPVQALMAKRAHGTRVVKTHSFNGVMCGHTLINWGVTAAAVYIVRDPLDVVVSMTRHFGLTIDRAIDALGDDLAALGHNSNIACPALCSWSLHVKSWVDVADRLPGKIIVLRYEDLLTRPDEGFTKVATLIGLAQDKGRIERAI